MNSRSIRKLIVIVLAVWLGLLVATYPWVPLQIAMRQDSAGHVVSTAEKSLSVWLVPWMVALIMAVAGLGAGMMVADKSSPDQGETVRLRANRTVLAVVLPLLWVNCIF